MIVLDLEMSGVVLEKNGIWQIAAMDLTNPSNLNVSSAQDNSSSIATMIKNNIPNLFRYE